MGTQVRDPREAGQIIYSGYWHKQSLVRSVKLDEWGWLKEAVEVDPDGRVRSHCTQWDRLDRILTPQYVHDCGTCTFLGTHGRNTGREADLYFCSVEPTVVARYSDDEPDYISGIEAAPHSPALREALTRARSWGFYQG